MFKIAKNTIYQFFSEKVLSGPRLAITERKRWDEIMISSSPSPSAAVIFCELTEDDAIGTST